MISKEMRENDPVFQKLKTVTAAYENAYQRIESFVERSKIIEDFDVDSLKHMLQNQTQHQIHNED